VTEVVMSGGTGPGLSRRMAKAAWHVLPLIGLVAVWATHLYYSVSLRPDVLWEDDWAVFGIPGYARPFDLVNIFGTQNDTLAAYQNALQYLMLLTTDLHFPSYIAVQNVFLLAFVVAVWRLLTSMDLGLGRGSRISAVLAALLLVPAFAGTHHFDGTGMRFNHNMPIVCLALTLLALRTPGLGAVRQPIAGCLLFLSGAAYVSGWMYLLGATIALALVRLFNTSGRSSANPRTDGLPNRLTMVCVWVALLTVSTVSIWLSHQTNWLAETGISHAKTPLVWPSDMRFWVFYCITVARGWGLPAAPFWGVVALSATIAPLMVLVLRLPRGSRQDAADTFALAAPVVGALFALAMVAGGRGLLYGADFPAVESHARTHPKYLMHMTFVLPFVAAAWMRTIAGAHWTGPAWRTPAMIGVTAGHLAGFVLGADGNLAERLDFRAIYGRSEAKIRDGGLCIENAVRLARATGPEVPIRCPGVLGTREMRYFIRTAERAGVASIVAVTDKPPVPAERISALIAEAAFPPAGRIDILETGSTWVRVAGRVPASGHGNYPHWVAVFVPGRSFWLARTTGGSGANRRAGPPGSFEVVAPTRWKVPFDAVQVWALSDLFGMGARAIRVGNQTGPLVDLLDAPLMGPKTRGGSVDAVLWTPVFRKLVVRGWALTDANDDGRQLRVLAPGAVSILRFTEQERPDVVAAHNGDARLLNSGFSVVLEFPKGAREPPCVRVWSKDRTFGRRVLTSPPDRDPTACTNLGGRRSISRCAADGPRNSGLPCRNLARYPVGRELTVTG